MEDQPPWSPLWHPEIPAPPADGKDLSEMLQNSKDFIIKCGNREFKVHRAVMSARSKYFERICSGELMEGVGQYISLKEDDPAMIDLMIKHIYSTQIASYDWNGLPNLLPVWGKLHSLGKKYEVNGLCELAVSVLKDILDHHRGRPNKEILQLIEVVYESTLGSSPLRNIVQQYLLTIDMKSFLADETVKKALVGNSEVLYDTFQALAEDLNPLVDPKSRPANAPQKMRLLVEEEFRPGDLKKSLQLPETTNAYLPNNKRKIIRVFARSEPELDEWERRRRLPLELGGGLADIFD